MHHRRNDFGQKTKLLPVNGAILSKVAVAFTDREHVSQMNATINNDRIKREISKNTPRNDVLNAWLYTRLMIKSTLTGRGYKVVSGP